MRIFFLIIVLLHGLIHLLGFIKAFGLQDVRALTMVISRPMGMLWLAAAVLFVAYGLLFTALYRYDWCVGLLAVILSQVLVVMFWKDARFGTMPNVLILVVALVGLGSYLLGNEFATQVKQDFRHNNSLPADLLTEQDIAHLPATVQEYLRHTKSVGQPKVRNFRAEFTGVMRGGPEEDDMPLHSVQYNFYQDPSRYFYMTATRKGLPISALHIYQHRTATFRVKLLNWLKVVDASGEQMNQGETVTLLNDMCFIAPATLIDPRISWEPVNDSTTTAIFHNGNISVSAVLYFNAPGELVNFISKDRFETDGKKYNNYPWATPVEDYKMMNGYLLPSKARLIYQRPGGDFTYGEFVYKSVRYNLTGFED
jgi:hypothetical protein